MTNEPGIALVTLIKSAGYGAARNFLDETLFQLLSEEEEDLVNSDRLIEMLDHLLDPITILRQTETRNQIVDLLPISKAKELADRMKVTKDKHIYRSLKIAASEPSARSTLESFFGVVRRATALKQEYPTKATLTSKYELFDHQRTAVSKVEKFLESDPHKVVLHMPTGSGKTRTSMHIVANHLRSKKRAVICWLAYSSELLEQAASEMEKAWSYLGDRSLDIIRFWGNRTPNLLNLKDGVVVAGLSKMHALDSREPNLIPKFADRTSLIVIDEAHQSIAPTYTSILDALYKKQPKNALLGLTATPGRTWSDIAEDRKLSDYFDRRKVTLEVEGYTDPVQYLISEGFLARTVFHQLDGQSGCNLSISEQESLMNSVDVPSNVLEKLGRDASRNRVISKTIKELMQRHNRILVFTPSVSSAFAITSLLRCQGVHADVLTGKTPHVERESIIRRFCRSSTGPKVLLNFGVLTTGFDAPATSAALIARPTKSLVLYSQMVGRATRGPRVNGNAHSEIITVVDTSLPGFGNISQAFTNWEDVWNDTSPKI